MGLIDFVERNMDECQVALLALGPGAGLTRFADRDRGCGAGHSLTIPRATERHPSPGAVGPASRLRQRYAVACARRASARAAGGYSFNLSRGCRMAFATL